MRYHYISITDVSIKIDHVKYWKGGGRVEISYITGRNVKCV